MVFKAEKISENIKKYQEHIKKISRKTYHVMFFIVCSVLSILVTSAIHFKILMEAQPGYLYNVYLINFLWMDILIGLVIGLVLYAVISTGVTYYFKVKEKENLKDKKP